MRFLGTCSSHSQVQPALAKPSTSSVQVGVTVLLSLSAGRVVFSGGGAHSAAFGRLLAAHPLHHPSGNVKRISLELGGNAPFIVFSDADIPAAVEGVRGIPHRTVFRFFAKATLIAHTVFIFHCHLYFTGC